MEKEMLQILENSSMGEKETKAVYSELLNLRNVSERYILVEWQTFILEISEEEARKMIANSL